MTNEHAERKILARMLRCYDSDRRIGRPDYIARDLATTEFARLARLDYIRAAELLADALARRAANKLKGETRGTP